MNIIASHQQGLFEQLQIEAVSLAGRPRDSAQRAVVYHHLADSLGMAHVHALLAAHGALAIDPAIASLERAARRAWWRIGRSERAALLTRVAGFGEALRELDRRRCEGALLAYRLVATPGLAEQARRRLDAELVTAFATARPNRGNGDRAVRRGLFVAHQQWIEAFIGEGVEAAAAALDWPLGGRRVQAAVDELLIPLAAYERAEKRGLGKVEQALRSNKALPRGFAVNPAQTFYALQRLMTARRRRADAAIDEQSPDATVRLAA